MRKFVVPSEKEVVQLLATEIECRARTAIEQRGAFRVGLSGGSVLNFLCEAVPRIDTDLGRWRLFFCDERFVPEADPESTCGAFKRALLPKTALQADQFVAIDGALPLDACAADYEQRIRREFGAAEAEGAVPRFDLLLLGMGPDGHTCSLFPGHALLAERRRLVAPIADSPKPPPERVTMTLPLVNNARCCVFAMCGAGKADIVKRVFEDREELPARLVAPADGDLICIFDQAAGQHVRC